MIEFSSKSIPLFSLRYAFNAYVEAKEQILADYEDQDSWNEKVVHNIAKAGFFSSDRTIAQYNADIWHCEG